MNTAIQKQIEQKIARSKKGELFVPSDFRGLGTEAAIKMALSRLAKEGVLKRIAHGLYLLPKKDPIFGPILPSLEEIAEAIASKEKIRIKPAGAYALNKLGLTTQVPTKLVYLTDGVRKEINVGKGTIKFKATTPKKLSMTGKISSLVIQALEELNPFNIDETVKLSLKELLEKEDPKKLTHDLKLAPAKVNDFLISLIKDTHNDRLVKA
jgi:hypothetical protein